MIRDGRAASVGVPILHVRTALPGENEAKRLQNATDLARLENRWLRHWLRSNGDALGADELRFKIRFPVLQKHLNHFPEIALKLIQRLPLRVSARKAGNESDIEPGIGTTLNDCGECSHDRHGRVASRLSQRVLSHAHG